MKILKSSFCFALALICNSHVNAQENRQTNIPIVLGSKVPKFVLKDQNGKNFTIADYIGKKKLVIYFYPKDESSVCTKEACAFRDSFEQFKNADAMVIGINSGSVESHLAFQKNHKLPFTLLSDPDNKVLKMFGVKNVMFVTGRETFLVDKEGKVVFKFKGMLKGDEHATSVLDFLSKKK
ncbi:peroxiredoxin [Pedobacter changchengzhani]|uniref:thioredoxin-dependent peroxiredoxin n=1 Tax=Pedobacter changchengzhani TaxID=2529274 RepID=A0A4R5MLM4_9SPHI|nr:peroxiredoxin [Pedobacter changchengzhani]TDG36620.1 peroxiredoxin [Pedobacter changchengzhani]